MPYVRPPVHRASGENWPLCVTQFVGDSIAATNAVTAPSAGATIASVTVPSDLSPGKTKSAWSIQVTVALLAGTPAAAEQNNAELRVAGTAISRLLLPAALNVPTSRTFVLTASPGDVIAVVALAAGSAGVTYAAEIVATMLR